jgi:adenylate cyclase class 2
MASEIEVKFHVGDLEAMRPRLLELGARVTVGRSFERNWRFDLPDGSLTARGAVLRLRLDDSARLTFKERTEQPERREEIEFGVDDPQAAVAFLGGLGYRQIGLYEKYRETFSLGDCQVMLDQLPFGSFIEIEGPSRASLQETAERLGLRWKLQVRESYLGLFEALRARLEQTVEQATFSAFSELPEFHPELLGLQDAGEGRLPPLNP